MACLVIGGVWLKVSNEQEHLQSLRYHITNSPYFTHLQSNLLDFLQSRKQGFANVPA